MHMDLMILGPEKYVRLGHWCLIPIILIFKLLFKEKGTNHQVLIKLR